jgi:hypothetical protein
MRVGFVLGERRRGGEEQSDGCESGDHIQGVTEAHRSLPSPSCEPGARARIVLLPNFMHRKYTYAVLLMMAMAFAASAAAQDDSLYGVWKAAEGERGTFKSEEGTPVFTIDAEGPMQILHVGRDYVELVRYSKLKGERRTHRFVPLSQMVLRRSKLVP